MSSGRFQPNLPCHRIEAVRLLLMKLTPEQRARYEAATSDLARQFQADGDVTNLAELSQELWERFAAEANRRI